MTKEEKIKALVKEQEVLELQYKDAIILANKLRTEIVRSTQKINWLSHLIRNPV